MKVVGKTPEGNQVVQGVFKLSDTHGMPLEILLDLLSKRNMVVDWVQFYKDAEDAGWKTKTIVNKISTAVGDVYGSAYKKEIFSRLAFCLTKEMESESKN